MTPKPISLILDFNIDRASYVYYFVLPGDYAPVSPASVKDYANRPLPYGSIVANAQINYSSGNYSTEIFGELTSLSANTQYTIQIVAEDQAVAGSYTAVSKITFKTLPCPKIDILTGFSQPVTCLTQGANATFQVVLLDPPTSGILKGTQWTINWGDGTPITNYTSAADYDIPPLALRQHLYSTVTSCNYVFTSSVRNPCGETRSVQYVAVVHGRDIPADGDGILSIVNNATGNSTIQVCAGNQTIITLRDNSTWNCQSPSLPGGLTPVPNSDPRNLEWLYGQNPSGGSEYTITGVLIGGLPAPVASGRLILSPSAPGSLSQAITIPATALAGQYFRVYLKNWNKCNWADADFVSTYVDIQVVSSPASPTAPSRTVCILDDKTLTVTSVPTGTITWYRDAALTIPLGTGLTYVATESTPGTYYYYVTDKQTGGLLCQSAATTVALTINPKPPVPALSSPAKNDICYGVEPPESYTITASVGATPPHTGFQWYRDGVLLPGRTYDTIYITKPWESGSYTVRSVGAAPSYCYSDPSVAQYVTVHTLMNVTQPVDQLICQNQNAVFFATTTEDIASWQWEYSSNGGVTFSTVGASAPYNGFNTNTLTITTPPAAPYSGYYYRVEMKTPPGQGGCRFKSARALLTINTLPTANAGPPITRCSTTPLAPVLMTGATQGGSASSVIWSGGETMGTWTQNANPALAFFTPSVTTGSFTATLSVTGTAACGGVVATSTRTIAWSQTPAAEAGNNITRCDATPAAAIPMTGASVSGTYSGFIWTGGTSGPALGTWTQNPSDPALAVFTPSAGITSGTFTATLSVTGTEACTGTNPVDTRIISWGQTPTAVAGPDLTRCDGSPLAPFVMTGASTSGTFTNQLWSQGGGLGTWTQNADPALAMYTPTANSGNFSAILSITGTGACTGTNVSVSRNIQWSYTATVNAGPDQSICALGTVTLAGTRGGGATSATWTGGTGTYAPNNTTLNAVYTPSAAERAAHTVTLTLTTDDPAGSCFAVSDNMTVSIGTVISDASLTSSGDGCSGVAASWLNIAITGGAPPYTLQYKLNGVVRPNKTGYVSGTNWDLGMLAVGTYIYEITVISDLCGNNFPVVPALTATIIVYQQPIANAGSDKGVCNTLVANPTAIPSIGTRTWSQVSGPGTITFTPTASTPAVTATADTYGAYVIRWTETNGVCTDYSDITVSYERLAAAGVAQNLCGTLSALLAGNTPAAGTGTWTKVSGPGTVSYNPNANTAGATATVSAYGTYVLRWTIANGIFCSTSSDVTITFEKPADAGAEQHLCGTFASVLAGNTPAIGTGTWSLVGGPGGVAFTPNVNTPAATATVTQYGTYVFRWTIANGVFCSTNNDVTVVYNPPGQVNQPSNQVWCNGENSSDVFFSTTNIGGTTTYAWTNSATGIGLPATGNGDILSFPVVNTGTAPVVATIVVTPIYSDGVVSCPGPNKTFTITVNPTAQVNQPADMVVCNNTVSGIVTFTTANTVGATTYTWSNSEPGIGLPASGSGNLPSITAINTNPVPVTATITVAPLFTNGGASCTGPSKTFTITVNPTGQVTQPSNLAICNTNTGTVAFTTTNAGGLTTYSWTNSAPGMGLPASGSGDISFTGTNAGTAPITGTIVVTPTYTYAGKSCPGPTKTFTITVNPTGQADQPANLPVCNGTVGNVNFTTQNTVGATTYAWTNDNASIGLGANGSGPISFIAVNGGTAPVTANITITPTFSYNGTDCPGPSKSFTITVNPTPTLATSLAPPDVCSNALFSYIPASMTAGTTFKWDRAPVAGISPAGPTTGFGDPSETLINTTNIPIGVTYQYTLTANGCPNIHNVLVNIKPEPVIVPGQTYDLCSGNMTNYHIEMVNFSNPADNVVFTWPAPELAPSNPAFMGGSARSSASAVNIADIYTNTTGATGTATYTVTPYKNGCAGTPETIVMTIRSQPVLSGSLNRTVCSNTPTGLVLNVAAGSVGADYYNISNVTLDAGLSAVVGNATIAEPTAPAAYLANDKYINITGTNKNVTYRVQPILAPDCFGTAVDVVITIRPQPYITPAQTKSVCSGIAIGKEVLLTPANTPAGSVFNWPAPSLSDFSVQGSAGINVAADPAGTIHINDIIYNYSGAPITATYTITPSSSPGCTGTTIPVVITINPEPIPKPISGRDKICINEKNIVYGVTSIPGSSFHWTLDPAIGVKTFDFNTNAIIIDAAAAPGSGNITVYETNFYGCNGDLTTLPVQVYTQAVPENVTGPADICANSTQTYSVTSRVGSVYSWTIPGGAGIIGDPSAASILVVFGNVGGTISCKETNIAGCVTNHLPLTVIVRPLPTAIINGGGTICDGGSMSLFIDFAGTGPYAFTYAINGVPQAPVNTSSDPYTLNVTLAGTYTIVNATDATGCTNVGFGSALVSYYPKSTGVISGGTTICGGSPTTLTMTFATGPAPYTFIYTDGTTNYTVPNWPGFVYTATVTPAATTTYTLVSLVDGNTCSGVVSGSAVVTVNSQPALTLVKTDLTCYNDNSGAVDLTITGNSPFGITWAGPLGFVANSEDISGLRAGTYNVTVTDTKGCISTGSVTLTEPGAVNASLASANIFCFGSPEGTITISAPSGGSGAYQYTIDGGVTWVGSGNFTGLNPGTYDVRIRDVAAPACNKILNAALVITGPAILNATVTETDIICYDAANGSIIISSPSGGFGTYGYSINGGGTWQGSGNFTNLTPGIYNVWIRDASVTSCTKVIAVIDITQPTELTATVNSTNVSCFGSTDGAISITVPGGGSGSWQYSINGGGSWQASGNYTNLTPGTYNVQIRDAAYTTCYKVLNGSLTITQPSVLKATVTSTMVSCNSANDGIINITGPSGGSGGYEYSINGGGLWSATSLYPGLTPGSYDVRIRDAASTTCEIILNGGLDITEPPALSGTVVKNNITCFGEDDGNITITNSLGGYGLFEYSLDGGTTWQSSNVFPGLTDGIYSVWMRDRIKTTCTKLLDNAVMIVEPGLLDAALASTNITCFNANNGTITISAPTGGFGTYQYSINGGGTWQGTGSYINLSSGSYDVRIRDAASPTCYLVLEPLLVIIEPPALNATVVKTNVTCFGIPDGTITINGAAGGYGTYEYTVDGGTTWQASNIFTGLLPGFYNVRIRDLANPGCTFTINGSLTISGPPVLNASIAKTNVTCNGANNGTITVSAPSGGYGTYQFSINGGFSWQNSGTYSNLPPATYNVQIRDASYPLCAIILDPNVIITGPPVLNATMTFSLISCNGASDGKIIISGATGGYGTYEYTINGGTSWSGSGNFLNLPPFTYDVRMRDAANPSCVLTLDNDLIITQPSALNAVLAKTDITCFGAANGTITVSDPTGGYGTYEYTINGGGSWQNSGSYTNLGPGNYNVQIRDAFNPLCLRVLNNAYSIIQLPAVSASVTPTMVTCNGANDGIINITAPSGGSGIYEYTINGGGLWSGSSLYTGLTPGVYDVRVRDAVNPVCETILNGSLTITQPSVINAAFMSTNITCNGANNGTITISGPSGGYGTYDYTTDGVNWQATGIFTNLTAGSYNVQIRDRACPGCVKTLDPDLIILEPAILSATVNHSDITCYAAGNGTITISGASGGYGTYQYSINGGVSWLSSGNFTGVTPGSYNVRIRDGANLTCVIVLATIDISQPDALSASVSGTNVTCNGANDGTISIAGAAGGYGTYEYSIDGGTTWQAAGIFTALTSGFYNIQMRDAVQTGCVKVLSSLTITEPGILVATVTKNDITCNGADDGKITITVPTGGYGTYEYSIHGAAGPWQASGTFTGLAPASYDVWIRDAAHTGCTAILSAGLMISEPSVLSAMAAGTDITCNGANDGTISVTGMAGGYGSYQYTINGTNWFGSGLFTNLAPATYTVQMRDATNPGCVAVLGDITITEQAVLNATVTSINVTCAGGGDGSITITLPTGGYGNYEYSINGGGSWQSSGTFNSLVPGSYNVRMRDADHINCVKILNNALNITQPAMLSGVITATMVTCNGANDGIINITSPTGGSGVYEYTVSGAANWAVSGSFTGLTASVYNVQIRDAANIACVITLNGSLTITEPPALNASVASTNVTCNGSNDGMISITSPAGGYGMYEYSKDGITWQATGLFSDLAPGTYNVQIRDKAYIACVKIFPAVTITEPPLLTATVNSTAVTCNSANDGTITISGAVGGYGTYGYSINGGSAWQSSGSFINLAPGTYDVRIRDAANPACVITLNADVAITEPPVLNATVANANVTCYNASDGTITISSPSGGYGSFEFSVNGGTTWQSSGSFAGLAPGFYNVQIRDAGNTDCVVILNGSLRITEPSILAAIVTKTNITCFGINNGIISITGSTGGYGNYEYSINGPGGPWQTSGNFTGISAGTYNVQIRDALHTGCVIVLNSSVTITEPGLLNATVTPTMVTCSGTNNGIITISTPSGGSGSFLYSMNGGLSWQGLGTFSNLAPADYDVRIKDAASPSCVIILDPALAITQPPDLNATLARTYVTCFGGSDGSITISSPSGGYGTYEFSINGGGSWQSSGSFTDLMTGSYYVLMRDAAHIGCMKVLNSAYLITQPGFLTATVSKTDISCSGMTDGTITISSPSGGNGTFEFSVDGGGSWQGIPTFTGLGSGIYDIRMRDAAYPLCYIILYPNLMINEPVAFSLISTGDIILNCNGDKYGSGAFYASGGTMPYTFTTLSNTTGAILPAPGFNSQSYSGAGAGSITVQVTDSHGCSSTASVNITQPAELTPGSIGSDQVLCSGQNPLQLTGITPATGGPGAYNYQWQYAIGSTGPFITIAGATANQYTPPAGATNTFYYRRIVTSGICTAVYSNIVGIRVNALPIAVLSGGAAICPGETSIIKVTISSGLAPFEADIENLGTISGYTSGADIPVTPVSTTTYKLLRVRDSNGCEVNSPSFNLTGFATITVQTIPSITSPPSDITTCELSMISFTVSATGSGLTYQWYVNDGGGFDPITDGGLYYGAGNQTLNIFGVTRLMNNYEYHVTVTGCGPTLTSSDAVLTVSTYPEILNQPVDSTICMNSDAAFTVTASGTGLNYRWEVNKGSGFINVIDDANFNGATMSTLNILNAPGTFNNYTFRVQVSGTCGVPLYSNFVVLHVNNSPVVTLNPAAKSICDGSGPVVFTSYGTGMIDSLRWQVFSGGVWSDIYDNAIYSGTASQQLSLSNVPLSFNGNLYRLGFKAKCSIVYSGQAALTVNSNPVVNFSALDPLNACGGVPLTINGNPSGGAGSYIQHIWSGDVGPLNNYFIQSPTFNTVISGTYNLNYKVKDSNGCYGNDSITVIVDFPDASFSMDISYGCAPVTTTFTKDMTGIAKFWWDFDDGSPLDSLNANPVHQFANTNPSSIGYYNTTLRVESAGGCTDEFTSTITVYPEIDATFNANRTIVCSGGSVTFTAVTPGASKYSWNFGDGFTQNTSTEFISHLYTNFTTDPVVDTVKLITTSFYSCTDTSILTITVMPVPSPQFSAAPPTQIFNSAGNPVVFTDLTNSGTWNYSWKFGDGGTSSLQNPTYSYTDIGDFDVTMIVSNANCSDSITHTVSVTPIPPVADFDSVASGCAPLQLDFNNTSQNADTPGTTFMWDFGDGNYSTVRNPSYTYYMDGIYRITLTVTGPGGISVKMQIVEVYKTPEPNFRVAPNYVFVNDESVRCFNLTTPRADSYVWEFGDGDTSRTEQPYHKYMEEGVYDITLWAYSDNGCAAKYVLSPAVTVEPAGELRFATVFTPNKDGPIERTDLPTGGTEIDQFFYPPIREKVINFKLQIFNRWGTLIFESRDINIPWNGYYKGQLCPQGVYVWYVEGKYANGRPFRLVGDITLLH